MMLACVFLCGWALLIATRGTPAGADLNRLMVERPAAWLMRVRRVHLAAAAVSAVLAGALLWSGGDDAVRMMGMAGPDVAAWLSTVELSVVVDALIAAAAALSALRLSSLRTGLVAFRGTMGRRRRGSRQRRSRVRARAKPGNDDDRRRVVRLAA